MSHFAFYAEPTPVDTRHGHIYVGVGESADGLESVSIVVADSDRHDIHLSRTQALDLLEQLASCTAALGLEASA